MHGYVLPLLKSIKSTLTRTPGLSPLATLLELQAFLMHRKDLSDYKIDRKDLPLAALALVMFATLRKG